MPPDERFTDDAVLRRVARARPPLPTDLSPTSERTAAIAERVLASPRPAPAGRAGSARPTRPRSAWRHRRPALFGAGGLTVAAVCAVVVLVLTGTFSGSSTPPALADVIHVEVKA